MPDPSRPMIGIYPIERELGRGGMGVVYLAKDPRLDRRVAIKVLPGDYARDPMRLARFEREAKSVAALNHPNVAAIYSIESSPEGTLLVLEYVPGRSLSEVLQRGPMTLDEALRLCLQIAEGIEAAHERAVVHRDLKPDNVRVTPDNIAKILDFGLATGERGDDLPSPAAAMESATTRLSAFSPRGPALTQYGMVMGTPGYMSPEQARGLTVDKRTDIWAFGCILFEVLTGTKAFHGATVSDAIAAVIDKEPDYSLLPVTTPNRVRELLHKCLTKEPRRRLRDIGDARIDMEDVLSQPMSGLYRAAASDAFGGPRSRVVARLALRLPEALPLANTPRTGLAISPDGSSIVYVSKRGTEVVSTPSGNSGSSGSAGASIAPSASGSASVGGSSVSSAAGSSVSSGSGALPGDSVLALRRLEESDSRIIPGAQGGEQPVFSPDSLKLAFCVNGRLRRVPLSGGVPTVVVAAPRPQGYSWDVTDRIYLVPDWQSGIIRVPASGVASTVGGVAGPQTGGEAETVVRPDPAQGYSAVLWPDLLPGGRAALVSIWTGASFDEALVAAVDLRTGQVRPLVQGGANPRFAISGHLIFTRRNSVYAVAFDPDRLEVFGQPQLVLEGVLGNALGGAVQMAFNAEGTLVYAPGPMFEPEATVLVAKRSSGTPDGSGSGAEAHALIQERRAFWSPALSPDAKRLALQVQGATDHLWVHDLDRGGAPLRVTYDGDNAAPVWLPDSKRLAFATKLAGSAGGAIGAQAGVQAGAQVGAGSPSAAAHAHDALQEIRVVSIEAAGSSQGVQTLVRSALAPTPCCSFLDAQGRPVLLYTQARPTLGAAMGGGGGGGGLEVWGVRLDDPTSACKVISGGGGSDGVSAASAWGASVSPDGRLVAFVSDQTGRPEVYVQPLVFPCEPGALAGVQRWQVSRDGGTGPRWASHGGELFYRASGLGGGATSAGGAAGTGAGGTAGGIIAVRIAVEPSFMVGRPRPMLEGRFVEATTTSANYDVFPDCERLIVMRRADEPPPARELCVVLNWFSELSRRVPVPQISRPSQTMVSGMGMGRSGILTGAGGAGGGGGAGGSGGGGFASPNAPTQQNPTPHGPTPQRPDQPRQDPPGGFNSTAGTIV